jgi:hypothetical protein
VTVTDVKEAAVLPDAGAPPALAAAAADMVADADGDGAVEEFVTVELVVVITGVSMGIFDIAIYMIPVKIPLALASALSEPTMMLKMPNVVSTPGRPGIARAYSNCC